VLAGQLKPFDYCPCAIVVQENLLIVVHLQILAQYLKDIADVIGLRQSSQNDQTRKHADRGVVALKKQRKQANISWCFSADFILYELIVFDRCELITFHASFIVVFVV